MKYKAVFSYDLLKLETEVQKYLDEGWKLQGGISVAQSDYYSENHKGYANDNFSQICVQAMIKE